MKKLLALLLALTMLLSLAACGKKDDKENNNAAPEGQDKVQTPDPQPDPEPAPESLLPDPEKDEMEDGEEILEDGGEEIPEEAGGKEGEADSAPAFRVSHEDVTLGHAGETFRLSVWDANGDAPDTCTYTYPEVASVDEAGGAVTAVAPGSTTVTVRAVYGDEQIEFQCIVRCRWTEEKNDAEKDEAAGGTESGQPDSPAASRPALADFVATLQGSYEGLGALSPYEGELLENYYPGLSGIAAVEEILVQETMMSTANVAVGLVKLSDDATLEDVLAVQNIFQSRITTQAEGGAWYPASCETWENGVITSVSNCVGMFVYPESAQELADQFTETFSN